MLTPQEIFWSQKIGSSYMEANKFNPSQRKEQRKEFYKLFSEFPKNYKILECGCNNGNNLAILKEMGFSNLYGVEIFKKAVKEAQSNIPCATITEGTMLDLPYKDKEFDVVFTSGVLIHQDPEDSLIKSLSEIYRVSNNFIIGLEDFSTNKVGFSEKNSKGFATKKYRGEHEKYWAGPYHDFIQKEFPDLTLKSMSFVGHNLSGLKDMVQYTFQK
jgi:pseudaminic acid biosynthesis-associated methylase